MARRRTHRDFTDAGPDGARREERGALSGDRVRIPMGVAVRADSRVGTAGCYQLSRLPTADEQARDEWPERDEVDDG